MKNIGINDCIVDANGIVQSPFLHDGVLLGIKYLNPSCSACEFFIEECHGVVYRFCVEGIEGLRLDRFSKGSFISEVYLYSSEDLRALPLVSDLGFLKDGKLVPRAENRTVLMIECGDDCRLTILFKK